MAPRQKQSNISASQKLVLERIAIRISNKPGVNILDGIPRTDGKTIYIPFSDKKLDISDLEGLVAHEGGHIRFQSVIDPKIPMGISPENPKFAQLLLNICEDARIDHILRDVFPGFWVELDALNLRFLSKKMHQLTKISPSEFSHENLIEFLLFLLSLIGTRHSNIIYSPEFSDGDKFKYQASHLGEFWQRTIREFKKIWDDLTFHSSVIAAKKIFVIIQHLYPRLFEELKKPSDSSRFSPPKPSSSHNPLSKEDQPPGKHDEKQKSDPTSESTKDPKNPSKNDPSDKSKDDIGITSKEMKSIIDRILKKVELQRLKTASGQKQPRRSKQDDETGKSIKKLMSILKSVNPSSNSEKSKSESKKLKASSSSEKGSEEDFPKSDQILEELLSKIDMELDEKFLSELHKEKLKIKEQIHKLKSPQTYEPPRPFAYQEEKFVLLVDDSQFEIKKYSSIEDLKKINQISNPHKHWDTIIRKNRKIIQDLKRSFQPIRKSIDIERGKKRGIISNRDLVQVRTSHGLNRSVFKAKSEKSGARLLMIVDESGSMSGRRINIAKEAVLIMAESLKDTRIEFAIVGFSAKGGKKILAEKVYKSFSHPLEPNKLGTLGLSRQFYENRDGTSIKSICLQHFNNNSTYTPIAILISDGQPYHGGTSYVGPVAVEDTRRSIMEIKQMGIQMFAISIDPYANKYIHRLYHQSEYFLVHNLPELPQTLMNLVKTMAKRLR
ncbi:MAG: cobaltochelatase CobT-related protein [Promethearchaeota archaeon]